MVRVKYLNILPATCSPKSSPKYAIMKKRRPRPRKLATVKTKRLIEKKPPPMVNALYGIGVKAATKIVQNALSAKNLPILII